MKTRRCFESRKKETVLILLALWFAAGCSASPGPGRDGAAGAGGSGGRGSGGSGSTSGGPGAGGTGPAPFGGAGVLDSASGPGGEVSSGDLGDVRGGDVGTADAGDAPAGAACGAGTAMLPASAEVGGLVVAPDGTIFFTQGLMSGGLMRIRPGLAPESIPLYIGFSATGITYDPVRDALYIAVFFTKKIMRLDLGAPMLKLVAVAQGGAGVDGVTLGEDGNIYFSDHVLGQIWRTGPTGGQSEVTASPLPGGPTGLAFGKDGKLYVSQSSGSDVVRLTLNSLGQETARETFASLGAKAGAGLAFDEEGNLFVAAEKLFEVSPAGKIVTTMPVAATALDFGAGALRCADLYVGGTGIKVQAPGGKGMDVPWHRRP
jgi:streptogramin lyase